MPRRYYFVTDDVAESQDGAGTVAGGIGASASILGESC